MRSVVTDSSLSSCRTEADTVANAIRSNNTVMRMHCIRGQGAKGTDGSSKKDHACQSCED